MHQIIHSFRTAPRSRKLIIGFTTLGGLLLVGALMYIVLGAVATPSFAAREREHPVDEPFRTVLNKAVSPADLAGAEIVPKIDGEWQAQGSGFFGQSAVEFKPDTTFAADTEYKIRLPKVTSLLGFKAETAATSFTTQTAPGVSKTGLASVAGGDVVAADYAPLIKLERKNAGLRELELRSTPAIATTRQSSDDTTFRWTPKATLPQGKKIRFELYDAKNDVSLLTRDVTIADAPRLKTKVKQRDFTPKDRAVLTFERPMERSENGIVFDQAGTGRWKNDTTYEYEMKKVEPGKTYRYTLKQGLRSKQGGIVEKDVTETFRSTGAVTVLRATPRGTDLSQARQDIRMSFSADVDRASAQSRFSISHGTVSSFRWEGRTMIATVEKLGHQNMVTARLAPGVKNAMFGLPSAQVFQTSFSTETRSKRLNVPYFSQQHSATCAVASLRMILSYRGISTSEMSLVQSMGYKPTKLNKKSNPHSWDDPNQMFVGNVDGRLRDGTAAGPNAGPVARVAQQRGRAASVTYGSSPAWIAQQIYAGNPVIMFGAFDNTGFISWKTPSGRMEKMNLTSHATAVVGVVGEPDRPLGFWVHDPLAGGPAYWTTAQVQADISRDAYGQAVVIR